MRRGALRVVGVIGEQDGAYGGQARVAVARVDVGRARRRGVDVGHELGLELEVHAGDARVGVAVRLRGLDVAAPPVHVEHERSKGLPLVVAGGDDRVAAEDAVVIRAYVRVAGERLANVGGHVEADVLPVPTRLVAGPDGGIALRAGPAVERDDVRALGGLVGHGVVGSLGSVQRKGVAGANPGNVGLERGNAARGDLLIEVAQQLPLGAGV